MLYQYHAILWTPDDVHDGDTVRLSVDLGFGFWADRALHVFRLYGIDTAELTGGTNASKAAAHAARMRLLELIEEHGEPLNGEATRLAIRTHKDRRDRHAKDSFGRWLVEILTANQMDTLNSLLIQEGLAKEYRG